jgi:hypothetical protein
LPGVTDAKVDLGKNTAQVSYDASQFDPNDHTGSALNRFDFGLSKNQPEIEKNEPQ